MTVTAFSTEAHPLGIIPQQGQFEQKHDRVREIVYIHMLQDSLNFSGVRLGNLRPFGDISTTTTVEQGKPRPTLKGYSYHI